jgi:hypothetical protein
MLVTAGRAAALAIGLPITLVLGSAGAVDVAGIFSQTSEHHVASYPWHGGPVSVSSGSGDVRIVAGPAGHIQVAYTEHYNLRRPTVSATVASSGVQLGAHCPGGLFGNNCAVNYVITVPASVALTVHTGDGDVDASGLSGPLTLESGNGSISLSSVSGTLVVRSSNGDVSASQIRATSVQASSDDGSVDIAFAGRPHTVIATSSNGDVDLTVPRDSEPYRTSTGSGNGSVDVTVATASSAPDTLTARSDNGDVTIAYPSG